MPRNGRTGPESTIVVDARGGGRAMRVTWHPEVTDAGGLVVLSLWRENLCVGSFRLAAEDVPDLVETLLRAVPPLAANHHVDTGHVDTGHVDTA